MNQYAIYLRKSRSDIETEEKKEIDILKRHETLLLELAHKQKLSITQIYREIVSGDSIAARPQMQKLLSDVEKGLYDGILVVDVDRLARGDTIDQGIVAQTFKYSDTKIITPMKTYNPNNEFDEEYFEFGLFMSRREYKIINRRLQRGRLSSVREGKYVANKPPYGYKRVKLENEKGFTLEPVKSEADTIKLIFNLYTVGQQENDGSYRRLGVSLIAHKLNDLKIPTKTGVPWSTASIRDILINPVYIGKIRWNWRPAKKKVIDGEIIKQRPRSNPDECIIVNGLHPAIISEETFKLAQDFISKNPPRPIGEKNTLKNPLAGIVKCAKCGHSMIRRPYNKKGKPDTLMCPSIYCDNVSSALHYVEKRILESLAQWLNNYKLKWNLDTSCTEKESLVEIKTQALKNLNNDLDKLNKQLENTHDLLEQGIYTTEIFLERTRILSERITKTKEELRQSQLDLETEKIREETRIDIIPKIEHLLEVYNELPNAQAKNEILKESIEKITYRKTNKCRRYISPDIFEITLYPLLPFNKIKRC